MAFKQQQKDLRKPDELQKLGQQALPWMEQHGKTVVTGVLGLAALGLIGAMVNSWATGREEQSSRDFGKALRVLEREVSASASEPKPGEEPAFKTEAEKDQAIVDTLVAFRSKHAGRTAARHAALPLAQALLRQGKHQEAKPLIDEYLANSDATDPLRPAAYEARGYVFEMEKKYDEAAVAFDTLARENKSEFLKGMGEYHHARMLLLKGDPQGAVKQLSEIERTAPGSSAARLAKERMALLSLQGVALPQPTLAAGVDAGI